MKKNLTLIFLLGLAFLAGCQKQNTYQGYIEGYFRYLASNSPGFLQSLMVRRGEEVKAGQTLFILDNEPESANVMQAQQKSEQAQYDLSNLEKGQRETILRGIEEQIRQAEAELSFAKQNFNRYQSLIKTNAISKQQFDQAKTDLDRANARYQQYIANLNEAKLGARKDVVKAAAAAASAANAAARSAEWYLIKKTIVAPGNGIIQDTFYEPGEFIAAGRPVVSLLIPEKLRVIFYLPEPKLSSIKLGDKVMIGCDGCSKKYLAIINYISSEAEFTPPMIFSEKERRKFVYRIEASLNEQDAKILHPGQPVDIIFMER